MGKCPTTFFFDNNCSLAKHVKNDPDFKDIGLSVDVFHFSANTPLLINSVKPIAIQLIFQSFLERKEVAGTLIPQLPSKQMFG